jgi:hypothetical protein
VIARPRQKKPRRLVTAGPEFTLVDLKALEGVAGGQKRAAQVSSRSAGMRGLMRFGAITAAGSDGAINVWLDDSGKYRCELYRDRRVVDRAEWQFLGAVDAWLAEKLPTIKVRRQGN